MTKEELIAQFRSLDTDGSGQIDVAEMLASMPAGTVDAAAEVLKMMDVDVNGQISMEEYLRFFFPDEGSHTTPQSELEAIAEGQVLTADSSESGDVD